jgi:predicted transcriptional regulator
MNETMLTTCTVLRVVEHELYIASSRHGAGLTPKETVKLGRIHSDLHDVMGELTNFRIERLEKSIRARK